MPPATAMNLATTGTRLAGWTPPRAIFAPWKKVIDLKARFGRRQVGPARVTVWHKPEFVSLTFHNKAGTWTSEINLTPDEALVIAGGLIEAARNAADLPTNGAGK